MLARRARESSVIPWFDLPSDLADALAVAGVLVTMGIARRRALRHRLPVRRIIDGFAVMLACSLILGHVVDVLLYRTAEFHADWQLILPWKGGYCSLGAFLGLALGVALCFREPRGGLRWDLLDQLVPSMFWGVAILRVGCFIGHHHAGRLSSFLLAVQYPGGARHDLGLCEALLIFALLGTLILIERRVTLRPGSLAVGMVCAYCLGRFGIEFLRGDDLETIGRHSDARYLGLTLVQYGALLACALGVLWLRSSGGERGGVERRPVE
jgi:phosphatidylglycerol:prolipoprotein diacylglycerol transferase